MGSLQTYSIIAVVLAICFSISVPLIIASDFQDNYILEFFESGEENQTEHEESQEELTDDDFKNDFMYNDVTTDSTAKSQFIKYTQLSDVMFRDPTSPPPECS